MKLPLGNKKQRPILLGCFLFLLLVAVAVLVYCNLTSNSLSVGDQLTISPSNLQMKQGDEYTFRVSGLPEQDYLTGVQATWYVNDVPASDNSELTMTGRYIGHYNLRVEAVVTSIVYENDWPTEYSYTLSGVTTFDVVSNPNYVDPDATPTPVPEQKALTLGVSGTGEARVVLNDFTQYSGTQYYPAGSSLSLSAEGKSGFVFDYWLMDNGEHVTDNPYVLTLSSSRSALAVFKQQQTTTTFTITTNTNAGGDIAPYGSGSLPAGVSQQIAFYAASGYQLSFVDVDGQQYYSSEVNSNLEIPQGTLSFNRVGGTMTFRNLAADHSIMASYIAVSVPTASASPTTEPTVNPTTAPATTPSPTPAPTWSTTSTPDPTPIPVPQDPFTPTDSPILTVQEGNMLYLYAGAFFVVLTLAMFALWRLKRKR